MTVDAIASIVACIDLHQEHVTKLKFNNCALTDKSALMFKMVLADEKKLITECDFDNNNLSDKGIDHIV